MIYENLKKGLEIYNQIKDKELKLKELQAFMAQPDFQVSIPGGSLLLPKAALNTKLNLKEKEIQDEIDALKAEFSAL